jgi:hypothetical protein
MLAEYRGYWGMGIMIPSPGPAIRVRSTACTPWTPVREVDGLRIRCDAVSLPYEIGHGAADEPHSLALRIGSQPMPGTLQDFPSRFQDIRGKGFRGLLGQLRPFAESQNLPKVRQRPLPQGLGIPMLQ